MQESLYCPTFPYLRDMWGLVEGCTVSPAPAGGAFACSGLVRNYFHEFPRAGCEALPRVYVEMADQLCPRGWGIGVLARADLQIPIYPEVGEVGQYTDSGPTLQRLAFKNLMNLPLQYPLHTW